MKTIFTLLVGLVFVSAFGQESQLQKQTFPITITIFSESIGLPNFKNLLKGSNFGVRLGTELYYRQRDSQRVFQTINIGFYRHKNFQNSFYLSSEFGYRALFGKAFADGTIGVGYLLINSALPRYAKEGSSFVKSSSTFGRFVPTFGFGAGYQLKTMAVFSRYEMFGEMPFGFNGLPVLPHRALHLGTRLNFN